MSGARAGEPVFSEVSNLSHVLHSPRIEKNHSAEILGGRLDQKALRAIGERVALRAFRYKTERNQRISQQRSRTAVAFQRLGESGGVALTIRQRLEKAELERDLNRSRLGMAAG